MKIVTLTAAFFLCFSSVLWATERKTIELGTHKMPNQTRFHCPDPGIRTPFGVIGGDHCRTESRKHSIKVWADVTYPSAATVRRHIGQCAVIGGGAAGIASIVSSPAAAMPVFKAAFETCLTDRVGGDMARRTSVNLRTKNKYTCWSTHCGSSGSSSSRRSSGGSSSREPLRDRLHDHLL